MRLEKIAVWVGPIRDTAKYQHEYATTRANRNEYAVPNQATAGTDSSGTATSAAKPNGKKNTVPSAIV